MARCCSCPFHSGAGACRTKRNDGTGEKTAMMTERVREDFPILKQTVYGKPLVYLDSAATSQKPRRVIHALARYSPEDHAHTHRGMYPNGEQAHNPEAPAPGEAA